MSAHRSRRARVLAATASMAVLLAAASPAAAAEPAFAVDFDAGVVCPDTILHVEGFGAGAPVYHEFTMPGGTARILSAGTGFALTFSSPDTDGSLALDANGAVNWMTSRPGEGTLMTLTGHNVVFLFPADGGPSTTLYVGRVQISVAADGVWTVERTAGTALDVCAAIS